MTKKSQEIEQKIFKNELNFVDFIDQMKVLEKWVPLKRYFPCCLSESEVKYYANVSMDDTQLDRIEAMVNSMTTEERLKPYIINGSRKKRIAAGSGTTVGDVNKLLKQFSMAQQTLKQFARPGINKGFKLPF